MSPEAGSVFKTCAAMTINSNRECSAMCLWKSGFLYPIRCVECANWWMRCSPKFEGFRGSLCEGKTAIDTAQTAVRALLLQVFYSIRSERLLIEQLDYNLLFRWFVGLEMDEAVWNHAVFSKNPDRLLNQELAQRFFARVKAQAEGLTSDEHFTVDGTLIEAWASHKSFQRKDNDKKPGSGTGGNFHGEKRTNDTHESKTDPEARLYKKSMGQEAKLSYLGHVVVENRNGLIAAAMTTQRTGWQNGMPRS